MTRNPEFVRGKEERNNESFFKMLQGIDVSSENMRALPHDFVRSFPDKELSCEMKIRTQWGRSWEVGIFKNPRFYFMEKSGWEKFVRDNALGHSKFITFTHKGKMQFTVNIFKQDGKEMIQPPQSAAFLASSSSIKIEQEEDDKKEEKVVSSHGRKLKLGKKPAEESQNSKRAEKLVCARRGSAGAPLPLLVPNSPYSSRNHSYLLMLRSVAKYYMPKEKAMFKIHHPDGNRSWDVTYLARKSGDIFSAVCVRSILLLLGILANLHASNQTSCFSLSQNPKRETH